MFWSYLWGFLLILTFVLVLRQYFHPLSISLLYCSSGVVIGLGRSQDNVVSTVRRLRAGWSGVPFPAGTK
jgi:hypothetical protein